jgi:mannose-6-phosphate isomerase-like protein (cupin superfamily)
MSTPQTATIARLAGSETVAFGPLSHYNKLLGDGVLPIFTGVQTCAPGYQTALHWHPYVEYLFVLEGVLEAWTDGQQDQPNRLGVGDMIALPANTPHVFRNPGPDTLRLLGIHHSPERVVHRIEDATTIENAATSA